MREQANNINHLTLVIPKELQVFNLEKRLKELKELEEKLENELDGFKK
ncbi:MAG: hypothetical protein AB7V50_10065 [Vampirovibrionia bacterium]